MTFIELTDPPSLGVTSLLNAARSLALGNMRSRQGGDLNQAAWRSVREQIEDIRLTRISNPGFDPDLPRVAVLAMTGRLVGNAPTAAHDYKLQFDTDSYVFEVWPLEHLIEMMADAPEAGLAGDTEAPSLGNCSDPRANLHRRHLEQLSLDWASEKGEQLWRAALIASSWLLD